MDTDEYMFAINVIRDLYNTRKFGDVCLMGGSASSVYTKTYLDIIGVISDVDVNIYIKDQVFNLHSTREYEKYLKEETFKQVYDFICKKFNKKLEWKLKGFAFSIYDDDVHIYDIVINEIQKQCNIINGYPVLKLQDLKSDIKTVILDIEDEMKYSDNMIYKELYEKYKRYKSRKILLDTI